MAHLSIPTEKATTSDTGVVKTQFSNVPFKVVDDAHDIFGGFLTDLTRSANGSFQLSGTTNALTTTAIGNLQLDGITFDVPTSLAGFNNFGGKVDILSLDVIGGTKDYAIANAVVAFTNPSQITIIVGDVNFSAKTADGHIIGQVFIKGTVIKPGVNQYNSELHLAGPTEVLGRVFTDYLTNAQVPLTVVGTEQSTAIEPLKKPFQTVNLATTLKGIQSDLVSNVRVDVNVFEFLANKAQAIVTLRDPLKTAYSLIGLRTDVFWQGRNGLYKIGEVNSITGPCTVPAGGSTTCDKWVVDLKAELTQLVEFVFAPDKSLNLQLNITALVGGEGGYQATFYYFQNHVPATLNLDLLGHPIPLGGIPELLGGGNNDTAASIYKQVEHLLPIGDTLANTLFPKPKVAPPTPATNTTSTTTPSQGNKPNETPAQDSKPSDSQNKPSEATVQDPKLTDTQNKPTETSSQPDTSSDGLGHLLFPFKA
ncbi:hypothetical protein BJ944DRAFT_30309 [Cunninghamella echinulata]|nr:hypothetical protein BJ944DRAFT_30309 [Cunninghamella echinulata]